MIDKEDDLNRSEVFYWSTDFFFGKDPEDKIFENEKKKKIRVGLGSLCSSISAE